MQTETGFHAAIRGSAQAPGGKRIHPSSAPFGVINVGILGEERAPRIDQPEKPALFQVAAHDGGQGARGGVTAEIRNGNRNLPRAPANDLDLQGILSMRKTSSRTGCKTKKKHKTPNRKKSSHGMHKPFREKFVRQLYKVEWSEAQSAILGGD
jgi:hypothetical protein